MFLLFVVIESMCCAMIFCMSSLRALFMASLALRASGVSFLNDSSMYVNTSASSTDLTVR